jgi:anti-anti-sigma regulatory factor
LICGKRQAAISGIVHAEIHKDGTTLILRAVYPRLDGGNHLLNALKSGPWLEGDVEAVEIDFGDVEYLNSLGITELVTIHRLVQEQTRGKTRFRFFNVDRKIRTILELVEVQKIAEIVPRP